MWGKGHHARLRLSMHNRVTTYLDYRTLRSQLTTGVSTATSENLSFCSG